MSESLVGYDAVPVHGYIVHNDGRHVKLPYPRNSDGTKPVGASFIHGKFVMGLRRQVGVSESC